MFPNELDQLKMRKLVKDKIQRILVMRTDRMGDVLLNIPAIRALKQSFNSSIVALVSCDVKELFEDMSEIDEIILYDEQKWEKNIAERLNLFRQLRRGTFNLAVILNPTKRFHILTYLAGITWRLGYNRKYGFLLTHKIEDKKSLGEKHEVEYNLDLVRAIGADTNDRHISIESAKEDIQFVKGLLANYGVKDKDLLIAIHPYSSNPAKCWPRERFAYVADELFKRFGAKVLIIGGIKERGLSIKLISLARHPLINLSGKLTWRQLAAVFQKCALLISNDSGPVHIAAACNIATVVIFGRNIPGVSPRRWGPWGNAHVVLHKDPGCNPCLDRDCPYDFKCLTTISAEEVLAATRKLLK